MHPLTPFAHWRWTAPYRTDAASFDRAAVVFPVRSKTGLVAGRQGALAHLDAGVAGVIEDGRIQFGARFLCAEGSVNVAILANPFAHGGVCEQCVDVVAGPCMYRCFNDAAALIYIGSAERWLRRLTNHRARTPWWSEVAEVRRTHYRSIFDARAAETKAIAIEQPLHNKRGRNRAA